MKRKLPTGVVWGLVCLLTGSGVATAQPFAYIANGSDNTVSVVDTASRAVTATISVGGFPFSVAVHPDGGTVYVTNEADDTVSVIDTATQSEVATVPVGDEPHGVAVHPDGGTVYVSNARSNAVSVIDAISHTVIDTVPVGRGPFSQGQFIGPLPVPVGDSTTGLFPLQSVCLNRTSGQTVPIVLLGETSWDCGASGLTVNSGDAVDMFVRGVRTGPDNVGGSVTGVNTLLAMCRNGTTGQTVTILLRGQASWDCQTSGLLVNPGDRVDMFVRGSAP